MPNELPPMDKVEELLPKLNALLKKLPTTLPCGSKDGPLAKYLTGHSPSLKNCAISHYGCNQDHCTVS